MAMALVSSTKPIIKKWLYIASKTPPFLSQTMAPKSTQPSRKAASEFNLKEPRGGADQREASSTTKRERVN